LVYEGDPPRKQKAQVFSAGRMGGQKSKGEKPRSLEVSATGNEKKEPKEIARRKKKESETG